MFTFSIAQWQGWAENLVDPQEWERWARAPFCPLGGKPKTSKLGFLPPIQRRRLSTLARGVFECAWPLAEKRRRNAPLVFASRHGETRRSFQLLQTLAAGEPLSPTSFCLSVHNAIAAQWSIMRGETAESVALAAEDDGLEHAFIEAVLMLRAGHEEVLVVVAEERPPSAYARWIADVPHSYVTAFQLRSGNDWSLTLNPVVPSPTKLTRDTDSMQLAPPPTPLWPNPLNLLRHLLLGTLSWQHAGANSPRRWRWTRNSTPSGQPTA
ncbi:beta-ketoacyl synthase chain length factor [Cephaloticoccus primus]|uniref:beta-ketoacyl synthase chain length factor n=1 Tax=Cephaloticoccus primus TaxID=1548207 RepID=UPI0009EE0AED